MTLPVVIDNAAEPVLLETREGDDWRNDLEALATAHGLTPQNIGVLEDAIQTRVSSH